MEHSALGSRDSIELKIKGMTDQFEVAKSMTDVLTLQYRLYSFLGSDNAHAWMLAFMNKGEEVLDLMDKTEAIAEEALERERNREFTLLNEGAHGTCAGTCLGAGVNTDSPCSDNAQQTADKPSLSTERRCDRQFATQDSLNSERRHVYPVPVKASRSAERHRAHSSLSVKPSCSSERQEAAVKDSLSVERCRSTLPGPLADKKGSGSPSLLPSRGATASHSAAIPIMEHNWKMCFSVPSAPMFFSTKCATTRPTHSPTRVAYNTRKDSNSWHQAKYQRRGSRTSRFQPRWRSHEPANRASATSSTNNGIAPLELRPSATALATKAQCDDRICVDTHDAQSPASCESGTERDARSARKWGAKTPWSVHRKPKEKENASDLPGQAHAGARGRKRSISASRRQSAPGAAEGHRPESIHPEMKRRRSVTRRSASASADAQRDERGESTHVPQKEKYTGSHENPRLSASGSSASLASPVREGPNLWHQRCRIPQGRASGIKALVLSRRSDSRVRAIRKTKELWSVAPFQPRKGKRAKDARRVMRKGAPGSVHALRGKVAENRSALRGRNKAREEDNLKQGRRTIEDEWTQTTREQNEKENRERDEKRRSEEERRRDTEEEWPQRDNERDEKRKQGNKVRKEEEQRKLLNTLRRDEEERQRRENEWAAKERKQERWRDDQERRRRRERENEEREKRKEHAEGRRERENEKKLEAQALERWKKEEHEARERRALERRKEEKRKERERFALDWRKEERSENARGELRRHREEEEEEEEEEERKEQERTLLKRRREEENRKEREKKRRHEEEDRKERKGQRCSVEEHREEHEGKRVREEEDRKEQDWQMNQSELRKQKGIDVQRDRDGSREQERHAAVENTKEINKRRQEEKGGHATDGKGFVKIKGPVDRGTDNNAAEGKTDRRRKRFEVRITEAEKVAKKAEDEVEVVRCKHQAVRDMCAEPAELKKCINNARRVVGKADGRLESLVKLLSATHTFRDTIVQAIEDITPRLEEVKRSLCEMEDQCNEILGITKDTTLLESAKNSEKTQLASRGVILISLSDSED